MNEMNLLNDYCKKGWKIFPVQSNSKLPIIKDWPNLATDDFGQVIQWVGQNDNCNWGMITGDIIVIDVDPKNGGSLDSIDLPETLTVRTGSGGYHFYYKSPGIEIRNSVQKLADGFDIRGSGGYVVLPPSVHPNGNTYEWVNNLEIAEFPIELVNKLTKKKATAFIEPEIIEDGKRNETLFKLGSSLRAKGLTEEAIEAALLVENEKRCKPPLDISEIETIVKSASRYEQGKINLEKALEENLTDLGNAERFVEIHKGNILYNWENKHSGTWFLWNGKFWERDLTGKVYLLAEDVIRSLHKEAYEEQDGERRKLLAQHAYRSESGYVIKQMVELARSKVPVLESEFDTYPNLITVENGILDLEHGELIPFDKSLKLTHYLPFKYNKDAKCPEWERSLKEYFPNEGTREYVQMLLGYLLSGLTDEALFWIFYGQGSNGKSTLIETFIEIFNPISDMIRYEELTKSKDKRNAHSSAIYDLQGKRAVFSTEIETDVIFDNALVKQITGDSLIKARKAHSNYSKAFKASQKLILQGNEKPKFDDSTLGFERRPVVIPFLRVFTKEEREKFKKSKIIEAFVKEQEGILNWLIDGFLKYKELNTLERLPEQVQFETDNFLYENDFMRQFIYTYCESGADYKVKVKEFKAKLNGWLMDIGEKTVSTQWITKNLENKKIYKGGQGNTYYLGIRLSNGNAAVEDKEVQETVDTLFAQ